MLASWAATALRLNVEIVRHTMEEAIGWPSLTSSPCTRRYPHVGFSVAMRITNLRIAAGADGRPGAAAGWCGPICV
jgi:hypothetical protein